MNAPCNGCADRTVGCHSVCEKYKDWKRKKDAERAKRNEESMIKGAKSRGITRVMKKSKWRK